MAWVRIRSIRDPAVWAPFAAAVLIGPLLGVCLHLGVASYLRDLQELSTSDPGAAAAAAERTLRGLAWFLTGFVLLFSALLGRSCQLGLRQGRMPPLGWWSLGAYRVATGATARRLGYVGLALAALLGLLGIALPFIVDHFIEALLSARPAP